jgi:hypothetical protein
MDGGVVVLHWDSRLRTRKHKNPETMSTETQVPVFCSIDLPNLLLCQLKIVVQVLASSMSTTVGCELGVVWVLSLSFPEWGVVGIGGGSGGEVA